MHPRVEFGDVAPSGSVCRERRIVREIFKGVLDRADFEAIDRGSDWQC
jgi:hypothetical protein